MAKKLTADALLGALDAVPESEIADIEDNAKRSVSIRINTSDYGRIKAISNQFKTRESSVFRFLLASGLQELAPLYGLCDSREELVELLCDQGPELTVSFDMDIAEWQRVLAQVNRNHAVMLDKHDIEIIMLAGTSVGTAAAKLATVTGLQVDVDGLRVALKRYLREKYLHGEHAGRRRISAA